MAQEDLNQISKRDHRTIDILNSFDSDKEWFELFDAILFDEIPKVPI